MSHTLTKHIAIIKQFHMCTNKQTVTWLHLWCEGSWMVEVLHKGFWHWLWVNPIQKRSFFSRKVSSHCFSTIGSKTTSLMSLMNLCVSMHVCLSLCVCVSACAFLFMCLYMCLFVTACLCVFVYLYISLGWMDSKNSQDPPSQDPRIIDLTRSLVPLLENKTSA